MTRWSASTILVLCFVVCILAISSTINYEDYMESSLKGPMEPDYAELLEYIRKEILIPPSSKPYNLLGEANPANLAIETSESFYTNASEVLFKNKVNGFFVEAGALDGESMSNTLMLESINHWQGLLVEADPNGFESMLLFATKSQFVAPSDYIKVLGFKMRSMNGLASYLDPKFRSNMWFHTIQCLPLESLLLALRVKTIDLLSLDVEGAEWDILQSFPFEDFDIRVIYMEWKIVSEFTLIKDFFKRKHYSLFQNTTQDYIFVKEGSQYDV